MIAYKNDNKEIWRKTENDYYAPSIYVNSSGNIGINCGGHVIFAPVERWHEIGNKLFCVNPETPSWKYKFVMWLMK